MFFYRIIASTYRSEWILINETVSLIISINQIFKTSKSTIMRVVLFIIGDTHIQFDNDMMTGHENIYVNGKLVSRKFSWFGTDHIFEVFEDGEWVEYIVTTGFGWRGLTTELSRKGIFIMEAKGMDKCYEIPISEIDIYDIEELV